MNHVLFMYVYMLIIIYIWFVFSVHVQKQQFNLCDCFADHLDHGTQVEHLEPVTHTADQDLWKSMVHKI